MKELDLWGGNKLTALYSCIYESNESELQVWFDVLDATLQHDLFVFRLISSVSVVGVNNIYIERERELRLQDRWHFESLFLI